jgi:hypothetical protein
MEKKKVGARSLICNTSRVGGCVGVLHLFMIWCNSYVTLPHFVHVSLQTPMLLAHGKPCTWQTLALIFTSLP